MFVCILDLLNHIRISGENVIEIYKDKIDEICPFQIFKNLVLSLEKEKHQELNSLIHHFSEGERQKYKEILLANSGQISNTKTQIRKIVHVKKKN